MTVAQPERRSRRRWVGAEAHHLALAEVIAAAVGAELGDLVGEGGEAAALAQLRQACRQGVRRAVVAEVMPVLAARPPCRGDAESGADPARGALGHHRFAQLRADGARLRDVALAAAGAGRDPPGDLVDQRAAHPLRSDRRGRQVELQQAHRALDVHADRPGVDVGGRGEDAADRSAEAAVRVRVERHLGDPGSAADVDRLLQADLVEAAPDGRGADHLDRLAAAAGPRRMQHRRGLAGRDQHGRRGRGGHREVVSRSVPSHTTSRSGANFASLDAAARSRRSTRVG